MAQQVKNLPANEGVARDAGSTPQSGRSPEEEMATHSSILAWKIPRTEEPGGLQSKGQQRDMTEVTWQTHDKVYIHTRDI